MAKQLHATYASCYLPITICELLSFYANLSRTSWRSPMKQGTKITTNRRSFLISSAAAAGLVLYPETLLFGQAASPASPAAQGPSANAGASKPRPDPLKPELVKEFVIAAHGDLEKTKSLLA